MRVHEFPLHSVPFYVNEFRTLLDDPSLPCAVPCLVVNAAMPCHVVWLVDHRSFQTFWNCLLMYSENQKGIVRLVLVELWKRKGIRARGKISFANRGIVYCSIYGAEQKFEEGWSEIRKILCIMIKYAVISTSNTSYNANVHLYGEV